MTAGELAFDVLAFRDVLEARDHEGIVGWIEVDPLAAREQLQKVMDIAKAHLGNREAAMAELRAMSFREEITRAHYEDQRAGFLTWKKANEGFVRVVGRYVQKAQQVQAEQRRARHEAIHGTQIEMESTGPWVRIRALEGAVEDLTAKVEELTAALDELRAAWEAESDG